MQLSLGCTTGGHFPSTQRTLAERLKEMCIRDRDDPIYANAEGPGFARIRNIVIRNVVVEDADPRYPILLSGLVGHPIQDVSIDHISVTYRGGLSLDEATDQRQINDMYTYSQYKSAPVTQSIPWLVNTFFAKNEALLPRIDWDPAANGGAGAWKADAYNVPEMPREYLSLIHI